MCLACDRWDKVQDNIYAIAMTIEPLRGIERWGSGSMVEQFAQMPVTMRLKPRFGRKGRIVICELLNSFPATVFSNALEMHSSIEFGIRPLLYSILRRQFVSPRDFAICANLECTKLLQHRTLRTTIL
jgi:hypothetical protein